MEVMPSPHYVDFLADFSDDKSYNKLYDIFSCQDHVVHLSN